MGKTKEGAIMTDNPQIPEFKGKVSRIDPDQRIIQMKDADDIIHPFKWTEPLDVVMCRWKPGYYLAVKYDEKTSVIKHAEYW